MAEDTNYENGTVRGPESTQSEIPTDKNIPATPPEAASVQEVKDMETHAHHLHRAPGRKLWH